MKDKSKQTIIGTVKYPEPVLGQRSKEVKEITQEIKDLAQDMLRIMILENGVGIAAPQIGIAKRVIIVDMGEKDSNSLEFSGPQTFVNPIILKKGKGIEVMDEGCLSVPGIFREVKRSNSLQVKALDLAGQEVNIKAEGFVARIFQHEVDHLNGILFINRLNFLDKTSIRKELGLLRRKFKQNKLSKL